MTPAERERVKELLSQAADLPAEQRRLFIERSGEKTEIVDEALDLLHTLGDGDFMHAPTGAGVAASLDAGAPAQEGPGSRIGRYKLLQRIGEGGFGTVFMAEQVEPVLRRVALKIIKAGMDTKAVIARFEAERQALAMMDHPNIARVFDAGATDQGRPYFVMELVRGDPVTQHCDRHQLSIEERLRLFTDICGAVQHAHQKGIIHRDLKPSNVLVTIADGRPLPKVIDFGIAKATATRLTDKTLFTEMHQLIGTPEYMSPEQAELSGVDIDTRSDVYSLGVLLYELLAGSPPFDGRRLRSAPFAEIQRIIRDEEPPRPSVRFRTLAGSSNIQLGKSTTPDMGGGGSSDHSAVGIAKQRKTEPLALSKSLRGDLDWIVMKCLEKDRARRYETASALANDVSAYLAHKPVSAMPPGRLYSTRKMMRRHRGAFLAGAVVVVSLLVATAISGMFAVRASRALTNAEKQRKIAEERAEETQQVAQFQQMELGAVEPELMGKRLRADLLENAKEGMKRKGLPESAIAEQSRQLAALLDFVNPTDVALKALEENIFAKGIVAAQEEFKDKPLISARLLEALSETMADLGLLDRALLARREALAIRRRVSGPSDSETLRSLNNLGSILLSQGKVAEAESSFREVIRVQRLNGHAESREILEVMSNLGVTLLTAGRTDQAEPYFRDLLEKYRRISGSDDLNTIQTINNVGGLLVEQGKVAEAEPFFREALERHQRISGPDNEHTLLTKNNLALVLEKQGKYNEALQLYREAFQTSSRIRGADHPDTLLYMNNLGYLLYSMERLDEAEPLLREAQERLSRGAGGRYSEDARANNNLGLLLLARGKASEAEPWIRRSFDQRHPAKGELTVPALESDLSLGQLLIAEGKWSDAEQRFREVRSADERKLNSNRGLRWAAAIGLARCAIERKSLTEAQGLLDGVEKPFREDAFPAVTRRGFIEAMIGLNEAMEKATPGQGAATRAKEWRAKLADRQAGTQP